MLYSSRMLLIDGDSLLFIHNHDDAATSGLEQQEPRQEVQQHLRRLIESTSVVLFFGESSDRCHRAAIHRYVVNAARVAKSDDPSHVQRIVYLSVRK